MTLVLQDVLAHVHESKRELALLARGILPPKLASRLPPPTPSPYSSARVLNPIHSSSLGSRERGGNGDDTGMGLGLTWDSTRDALGGGTSVLLSEGKDEESWTQVAAAFHNARTREHEEEEEHAYGIGFGSGEGVCVCVVAVLCEMNIACSARWTV